MKIFIYCSAIFIMALFKFAYLKSCEWSEFIQDSEYRATKLIPISENIVFSYYDNTGFIYAVSHDNAETWDIKYNGKNEPGGGFHEKVNYGFRFDENNVILIRSNGVLQNYNIINEELTDVKIPFNINYIKYYITEEKRYILQLLEDDNEDRILHILYNNGSNPLEWQLETLFDKSSELYDKTIFPFGIYEDEFYFLISPNPNSMPIYENLYIYDMKTKLVSDTIIFDDGFQTFNFNYLDSNRFLYTNLGEKGIYLYNRQNDSQKLLLDDFASYSSSVPLSSNRFAIIIGNKYYIFSESGELDTIIDLEEFWNDCDNSCSPKELIHNFYNNCSYMTSFSDCIYRNCSLLDKFISSIGDSDKKVNLSESIHTYRPYPNPANNLVTLPFDFMSSENLTNMDIKLIDVSGRDVSQFADFNIRALNHYKAELEIKLDNIQRGIYFIQMTLNGTNKTSSFIKLN